MPPTKDFASIADASQPNAGRIYDFLLGGNHNFEVDRQAAQGILQLIPVLPKLARLIRWFLGEAVRRLSNEGFQHFIDFASGLPTVDHVHQIAPPGSKIIYSDVDPVTVAYGQEIVKDNPNVRYVVCNVENPIGLLESQDVKDLFGSERKVAIGFNGIAYFLPDEKMAHSLEVLYQWAAPGSKLFMTDAHIPTMGKQAQEIGQIYAKMNQPYYARVLDTIKKLVGPWKVAAPGFLELEEWVEMSPTAGAELKSTFGSSMVGCILSK
ncbi:MAG TPA: SAM-dependent methyltransferase [Spirochaetia bacterium]|nr:SAM-dependent methyltransferase [Spirochaetia bacterium]